MGSFIKTAYFLRGHSIYCDALSCNRSGFPKIDNLECKAHIKQKRMGF